ncbi:MAG: hypothetical protein ACRYFX_26795 [Janthinobacterium lividum]
MTSKITLTLLLASLVLPGCTEQPAHQALAAPFDKLGAGLLVLTEQHTRFFADSIPLFQDSLTQHHLLSLTPERTTCPTCMQCAEPTAYHHGPIQPFECGGGEGIKFICLKATRRYTELVLDTLGHRAYLRPGTGTFYTWKQYMQERARQGDYFQFVRQWDRHILYDQPYDLRHLPPPGKDLLVGLTIQNLDDVKFYPVLVQGYWLKLRYQPDTGLERTCWVVWRNEKAWLLGFKFRTD